MDADLNSLADVAGPAASSLARSRVAAANLRMLLLTSFLALLYLDGVASALASPTVIENVQGFTLSGNDLVKFSALAFDDGKVLATGDGAALLARYPNAKVVDGRGRTLLPGLIDAHGHVLDLGLQRVQVNLTGSTSLANAQARLVSYAKANPQRTWLEGDGWNQVAWHLGRFPTAQELDAAVADRPAVLGRIDGHATWLNTRALAAAGITRDTADPIGGRIERDAAGNPSGVLVDKAMDLMTKVIPQPTVSERRAALLGALADLNSVGLTGVGDAGVSAADIALYQTLATEGRLTVRVYAMIGDVTADFEALSKDGPLLAMAGDMLTVRSVKLYADGALGSRGAALLEPYSDKPDQRGLLFSSDGEMERKIEKALEAGYQVNVHAIGDAANRQVLDGFEKAFQAVGGRALRNRIEHAQVISPQDMPRFKTLELIASMQPTHATSDMNMAEDRLGKDRIRGAYAWRTLLAQGTRIAAGSDFPVESDNPFFGLHAAVTRTDHRGRPRGGWHPEQAMSVLEAFRAFTLDAAYAQHQEDRIGSLEPGKWADFILVDRNLFTIPAADIWKIKTVQTWIAGKKVFDLSHRRGSV